MKMNLFDLLGRVAIITGGSRGIGLAIAEGLASAGAAVVIGNRTAGQGEQAAEMLRRKNLKVHAIPVDVSKRESVRKMVSAVLDKFQKIDILVNSAAIILRKPIAEITDGEWDSLLDTNLKGIFICCQEVGRHMIERKQGKIINISSNVIQPLQPGRGVYAITKAGLTQLTRVLAFEWAQYNVHVNAIAPGPTITDLNRRFFEEHPEDLKARIRSMPIGRMGQPQDHVGAALLLASPASDFITGQTIFVDGGSNLI
jgi:NAD(P)-dependent dehydrogenase (short-subunit alcohol dehydrogenase family)